MLLIACVNVANLQLAQAAERRHEIALRTALGASTRTDVRQLLVESVLLAAMGGLAGLALAVVGVPALLALSPVHDPAWRDRIGVDWRVLGFALAVSLLRRIRVRPAAGVAVGAPELDACCARARIARSAHAGRWTRRSWSRSEVALALMLTIGAFLLVKSLAQLQATSPGLRRRAGADDEGGAARSEIRQRARTWRSSRSRSNERCSTLPGVRAAAVTRLAAAAAGLGHAVHDRGPIRARARETGVG